MAIDIKDSLLNYGIAIFNRVKENCVKIYDTGVLRLLGSAEAWDDIIGTRIGVTGVSATTVQSFLGSIKAPAFDSSGPTEEEFWYFEIMHDTKLPQTGADIHWHYLIPNVTTAGNVKMNIEYWVVCNGETIPEAGTPLSFTKAVTSAHSFTAAINTFTTAFDLSDCKIGDFVLIRLTRDNTVTNNFTGRVFSTQLGIHRLVDGFGSEERFIKTL